MRCVNSKLRILTSVLAKYLYGKQWFETGLVQFGSGWRCLLTAKMFWFGGPLTAEIACSLRVCLGFVPQSKDKNIALVGDSKLPLSMNVCASQTIQGVFLPLG